MANKNTNLGGGKDDNEMRIWFGLILKIMVRTKSFILPELCYLIKPIG